MTRPLSPTAREAIRSLRHAAPHDEYHAEQHLRRVIVPHPSEEIVAYSSAPRRWQATPAEPQMSVWRLLGLVMFVIAFFWLPLIALVMLAGATA